MSMFCYQCEQTAKGEGCTKVGVCGKDPDTAALQDLLVHTVKMLSMYAHRARQLGVSDPEINTFTLEALFATVTNVNFDIESLFELVHISAGGWITGGDAHHAAGLAARRGEDIKHLGGAGQEHHLAQVDNAVHMGANILLPGFDDLLGGRVEFIVQGQHGFGVVA